MILILLAAAVGMTTAANLCCAPDVWEGDNLFVMGSLKAGGSGSIVEGMQTMSFDSVNKLIAVNQKLMINNAQTSNMGVSQRVIMDYSQKMAYIVKDDGACSRYTLDTPWVPICIPDNATATGSAQLGLGDDSVMITNFGYKMNGQNMYMGIDRDSCTPLIQLSETEGMESGPVDSATFQTVFFLNIKAGISDRSVFFIPVTCNSSPVVGPLSV